VNDFFISYNRADQTWAEWIAWVLEEQGYTTVIDVWDFRPGSNFALEMQKAAGAQVTVMVLSEQYLQGLYTQPEWAAAFAQDPTGAGRRLLPIRVGECQPTGLLMPQIYVNLVGQGEAEAERLLLNALKERGKPDLRPSFPGGTPTAERVNPQKRAFPGRALCPHNLPRSGAVEFVGRETDLENLHAQLQQTDRLAITAIRGMGGIGKTELALQYARYHRDQHTYPGGICWLQARDQDVASQIVSFAKLLNLPLPEGELTEQVAYVWSQWPLSEAVLVVFDDVADFPRIKPYLPPEQEPFRVLMTTRQQFSGIESIEITVLSLQAALNLLKSLMGTDRIEAELADAEALCQRLGFLPLALELVGRYLELDADLSLAEVQAELDEMRTDAYALLKDESAANMTAKLGVAEAFELSLRRLNAESQTLATVLCLFAAAPIAWEWVAACLPEVSAAALKQQRRTLLQNSLLQRVEAETYQLHPLIQEFLRTRFANAASTEPLLRQYCAAMVEASNVISYTQTQADVLERTPLIPHLKEAATTWQRFIADADVLSPANKVGLFYYSQGAFHEAEEWFEQALLQTRDRLGEAHPAVATSLNNLAELYRSQGRYEAAEPLYQEALAMMKALLGETHPAVATSLNNLAALYDSQGRYEAAELLYQEALAMRQALLGDRHPDVATSLNNLAELYRSQGRYEAAELLYQEALAMMKALLGETHPAVATSLNNLAALYDSQGRYEAAEPLYQEALAMRQALLGDRHPDVATSLNNLAELYRSQGRYEAAEPLYQEALAMMKALLGAAHPAVATSLNNLAALYKSQGRYEAAELLYQEALAMRQALLGDRHPDVATSLNNLALLYESQRRYEAAEPLFQEALAMRQALLGETHPAVATSLNNLALLYKSQGRYEAAEPLYQEALAMRQALLGETHPDVATSLNNLAVLYANQGRYQQAEPLLQQALELRLQLLGPAHPLTQSTQQSLEILRGWMNQ
jgi:tetratricopeptide (TPR) repeat protein